MIIYLWHPLGFLGAWLSVDLVYCAVLARQNHTSKIIQQAGLFCRLCSERSLRQVSTQSLAASFFPLAMNMCISQVWDKKKGEPCFSCLTSQNVKKIIWKKIIHPLLSSFFPLSREMPFCPSHDMFNITNVRILSVYKDPKFFSFPKNRTSSCAECYFSLVCPNFFINQPWLFERLCSLWLFSNIWFPPIFW